MIIFVQKLTQMITSNTAGFLRIQKQENTKQSTKKTTEVNLKIKVAIAQSIGQKGFAD